MKDETDSLPAPSDDELDEFDRIATQDACVDALFKLAVPRLTKEIRRLRLLTELQEERERGREPGVVRKPVGVLAGKKETN